MSGMDQRDVVLMMMQFCQENGMMNSFEMMQEETGVKLDSLDHAKLCENFKAERWDLVLDQCSRLPLNVMISLHELIVMELAVMKDPDASFYLFTHSEALKTLEKSELQRFLDLRHYTKYPTPFYQDKKRLSVLNEIMKVTQNHTSSRLLHFLKDAMRNDKIKVENVTTDSAKKIQMRHSFKFGKKSIPTCSIGIKNFLIIGTVDGFIEVWDTSIGKHADFLFQKQQDFMMHTVTITCLDVFDQYLVSGDKSGTIRLWDWAKGTRIRKTQAHSSPILSVKFSLDGSQIVSTSSTVKIHGLENGGQLKEFSGHQSFVNVALFVSENLIASVSSDCSLKLWNYSSGDCIHTQKFDYSLNSCYFLGGSIIFIGQVGKQLFLYDTKKKEIISTLEGDKEFILSGCNRDYVVALTENNSLHVYSIKTSQLIHLEELGHKGPVTSLYCGETSFSTTSNDGTSQYWSLE